MGRYFCEQISPFWLDNRDVQGRNEVRWRLGKDTSLPPPCSNPRSFGSKCTVLKQVLTTFLRHFCPRSYSAPGELCPLVTSLVFKTERHELLFHEHLQFSNTIGLPHGSCTDCQQGLLAVSQVSSCSFCVTSNPAFCGRRPSLDRIT